MNKLSAIPALFALLLLFPPQYAGAEDLHGDEGDACPRTEKLKRTVEFLSSKELGGRGRGTSGHAEAAFYLAERFRQMGLKPISGRYSQSFRFGEEQSCGHNIMGLFCAPGTSQNRRYIIIGAHYDHLGTINGKVYPGADSNASGVVGMLEVARLMCGLADEGKRFYNSVIFIAFDASLDGMEGSAAFWRDLNEGRFRDPVSDKVILPSNVCLMADLDQIGSSRAPVHKNRRDYLITLGEESLPGSRRGLLGECNRNCGLDLDLCFSYYGSEGFTKMFYRLGDRRNFIDHGIPTLLFTSGITDLNNKPRDNYKMLDYEIFSKRITLIFNYIKTLTTTSWQKG